MCTYMHVIFYLVICKSDWDIGVNQGGYSVKTQKKKSSVKWNFPKPDMIHAMTS